MSQTDLPPSGTIESTRASKAYTTSRGDILGRLVVIEPDVLFPEALKGERVVICLRAQTTGAWSVEGEDITVSSNAAMHLVAALIVGTSPSLVEAEAAAITAAAGKITEMVKLHWGSPLAWRGV